MIKITSVDKKYLTPAGKLANYEFPEQFAIWAFHFSGVSAHTNNHNKFRKDNIEILDKTGHPFGTISYIASSSPNNIWIVINDVTQKNLFIDTIEKYLIEVLGITLAEKQ